MKNQILVTVLIAILCCQTALSQETQAKDSDDASQALVECAIENGKLFVSRGEKKTEVDLAGPALSFKTIGDVVYVALGEYGAAVVDIADPDNPKVTRRLTAQGRVVGFFAADGRVWMQVESTAAVPVEERQIAAEEWQIAAEVGTRKIEPSAKAEKPKFKEPIQITDIFPGKVRLNVGKSSGVKVEDRFSVFRQVEVDKNMGEEFEGKELVAVLQVTAVSENSSLAQIWRGDRVAKGDEVEPASPDHEVSRAFPRHLTNTGEIQLVLRPLLKVGTPKGFGGLCDLAASWWGKSYFAQFRMEPFGFGITKDGNIVSTTLLAEGGYNGRAFAVGLGVGMGIVSGDMNEMLADNGGIRSDLGENTTDWKDRRQVAFALSQVVRLGARDGLHLTAYNTFLYYKDDQTNDENGDESGFVYGGTSGRFTIPLSARTDLFLGGGGGTMGYGFGELGIFVWVIGNGDAGSLGLSTSAGGAGVWGSQKNSNSQETRDIEVAGPMVSLGLTYRFGFSKTEESN